MRPSRPVPPGCDPESIVLSFLVPREQAGLRLDRFLQVCIPRLSRTKATWIVRKCGYHASGQKRMPSDRVRAGETVIIVRPPMNEPETPDSFDVIFEDEALVVVDKPSGLAMHPTATYHKKTLAYMLRTRYGEPSPQLAHRLDRETSGIVVCGRTLESERVLKRLFEDRAVDKTYLAIVRGVMKDDEGVIDLSMAPAAEGLHIMMEVVEEGLPARTTYRVLARTETASVVELFPETGRQHQLRVHLAAIGHPIIGCKLYGPEGFAPFEEYIETGMTDALALRLGHPRHALHAAALTMPHPTTGEPITFRTGLPPDLAALWASLGGNPLPR